MTQVQNKHFAMNWNAKYIKRLLLMLLLPQGFFAGGEDYGGQLQDGSITYT